MTRPINRKKALATGATVYIRRPTTADRDEFIRLNRVSVHFYRGLVAPIATPSQFAKYIERCQRADFEGFLVCKKQDDTIVGWMNLSQIFMSGFKSCYLGYQVGAPFAGQGYMTEAIQLVMKYAFEKLKLHRLEANIQPGNDPSIALVKRAGFTREGYSRKYLKIGGRWRDHERWAIVVEDCRAQR